VHDFLPFFFGQAGDIKTSATDFLNMVLDGALGFSEPFGQLFPGNIFDPT
jgi:hypothetical protein